RQGDAPRPVRRPRPAGRLPLHGRARGRRRLQELLVLGRQLQPERGSSERAGRLLCSRLARPDREARGVPPANGVGLPLGLVRRDGFQLRLRSFVYPGAAERAALQLRLDEYTTYLPGT